MLKTPKFESGKYSNPQYTYEFRENGPALTGPQLPLGGHPPESVLGVSTSTLIRVLGVSIATPNGALSVSKATLDMTLRVCMATLNFKI